MSKMERIVGLALLVLVFGSCDGGSALRVPKDPGAAADIPTSIFSAPGAGAVLTGRQTITWRTLDSAPGTVEIRLSKDSGATYPFQLASATRDDDSFEWDTNEFGESATCRLRITPTDASGNLGPATETADFTLDHKPRVDGLARYEDANRSGKLDAGDRVIVPFRTNVALNGADGTDFVVPVVGDSLGGTAVVTRGPASNELTLTLTGTTMSLKTRQAFPSPAADLSKASGIALAAGIGAGRIHNPDGNYSAIADPTVIDIVPGFVDSGVGIGVGKTSSVAFGDLDRDGKLDFVEGKLGQPNRVWFGVGNGKFIGSTQPLSRGREFNETNVVELADVNGDGYLDLIVGNADGIEDELWVWNKTADRNEGFELRQTFTADAMDISDTTALAVGDVDHDGDLDLVTADKTGPNSLWENFGGFFRAYPDQDDFGDTTTTALALVDVDRDGYLDLIEGNLAQADRVWIYDSTAVAMMKAVFPTDAPLGAGATTSIATGDINRDGFVDVLFGDDVNGVAVWLGSASGLVDSTVVIGDDASSDIALADFDQDGALDLVVAVHGGGNRFWLNDHAGGFLDSGQSMGSLDTRAIAIGDVDGDGDIDLLEGNEGGGNRVWLQSVAATWGGATFVRSTVSTTIAYDVRAGDFDRDGDLDLVVSQWVAGGANVFMNNGVGQFSLNQNLPGQSLSTPIGDIDNDGDLDLVESGFSSGNPDQIWLNDGLGVFSAGPTISSLRNTWDAELVDVDSDGDLDYVSTDTNSGTQLFLNMGASVFVAQLPTLGASAHSIEFADFDGDGNLNFAASLESAISANLWRNTNGTFSLFATWPLAPGTGFTNATDVAVADFNQDGALDLVIMHGNLGTRVFFNPGNGAFTLGASTLISSLASVESVAVGDVNGDGVVDIVLGAPLPTVFFGDSGGGFTSSPSPPGANRNARGLSLADIDGDGDLDVLSASSTGGIEVWFNR